MDDDIRIAAALGPGELPDDLTAYARANAHRKVNRLLERVSLAPFAAGRALYQRHPVGDPDRVGLLTVSGWDPDTPEPDAARTRSEAELSDFYLHPRGVGDYLQRMPNNALCLLAIATGFRGPNVHYTGAVESLALTVALAGAHLRDGSTDAMMVLAYDLAATDRHALPDAADGTAAALLLVPAGAGGSDDLGTASELAAFLSGLPRETGAVDAVRLWLAGARTGASA